MRHLGKVLWLVPLVSHIAYILATYGHLPTEIGQDPGNAGISQKTFFLGWCSIISAANIVFVFIHIRLPHFSDRVLNVPGQAFWLANENRKRELIERLQGICETALLGLNVFFLSIYQSIYQTNVYRPVITIPLSQLLFFFMVLPLLVVAISMLITIRGLANKARKQSA